MIISTDFTLWYIIYCVAMSLWMYGTKKLYRWDYNYLIITSVLVYAISMYTTISEYFTSVDISMLRIYMWLVVYVIVNYIGKAYSVGNKHHYKNRYRTKNIQISKLNHTILAIGFGGLLFLGLYVSSKVQYDIGLYMSYIGGIGLVPTSFMAIKAYFNKINRIGMKDDLNCWGLRFVGLGCFAVAILAGMFGTTLAMVNASGWALAILSIELIFLGAFCEFRSVRRHGVFIYTE